MKKIKVTLSGNKKDGYVLSIYNPEDNFLDDIALTYAEILEVKKVLDKIK